MYVCVCRLPKFGSPISSPFFIKNTHTHTNPHIIKCIFPLGKSCCSLHQPACLSSTTLASTLSVSHGNQLCLTHTHTHTRARPPRDWSNVFMPVLDEEMLETLGSLESVLTTSLSLSLSVYLNHCLCLARPLRLSLSLSVM